MADLVDQILTDSNSVFNEADREQLSKLPEETLKRLVLATTSQVQPTELEARKADLADCQNDIRELLTVEATLRQDLATMGYQSQSVVETSITNAAPLEITEQSVMDFVKNSKTVTAMILREGLAARDENRAKSISVIVANSTVYTEPELRQKFTSELVKLAAFIQQTTSHTDNVTVYNWDGAGLADQSNPQLSGQRFGEPLQLPTTFQ